MILKKKTQSRVFVRNCPKRTQTIFELFFYKIRMIFLNLHFNWELKRWCRLGDANISYLAISGNIINNTFLPSLLQLLIENITKKIIILRCCGISFATSFFKSSKRLLCEKTNLIRRESFGLGICHSNIHRINH